MATKLRLQRHGRKGYPYYHIVAADVNAPRDGKFIERVGSYNPNTNPATVQVDFEVALKWVMNGAQPTPTVRNILSDEGVYLMKHLKGGVKKGAFDEAEAEKRFNAWKEQKAAALNKAKDENSNNAKAAAKKRQEEEAAKNKAKAEAIAKKRQEAAEAAAAAAKEAAAEAAEAEAPAAETPAEEAPAAE